MKKRNKSIFIETAIILLLEIIISLVTVAVFLLINKFSYKVITGVALGSLVTVINYLILAMTTERVINNMLEARGEGEMDEETAAKFAKEYEAKFQSAAKLSYVLRNALMLITLVVAFLLKFFNVFATVIPLLAFRPIITVMAALTDKIKKKKGEM